MTVNIFQVVPSRWGAFVAGAFSLGLALLFAGAGWASSSERAQGSPAEREPVDVLLVLATDVSASIQGWHDEDLSDDYAIQRRGIVETLKDPAIHQQVERCSSHGIGLTYVEWAGARASEQVSQAVPWRKIKTGPEMIAFANEVAAVTRQFKGSTDVIAALKASARLLFGAPYVSDRLLIDISSDGDQALELGPWHHSTPERMHDALRDARDELVMSGIVINALTIGNDTLNRMTRMPLEEYYADRVQGGAGSFVVPVRDFHDFARGFKEKLIRELNLCVG